MTTTTNLYDASKQWAERPADQRFETLDDMYGVCRHYAESARTAHVNMRELTVTPTDGNTDLALSGRAGNPARLTHWSFGQLCNRVAAPAGYLRDLPAPIAADCLTHGLQRLGKEGNRANALFHSNGNFVCRAFTSDDYARIWNWEIVGKLRDCLGDGWRVPPARPSSSDQPGARPATEADCLDDRMAGLGIKPGDLIAPAGLYASDHDCFIFMVNEQNRIEDGSDGGLSRGFFISNSEVGASALKVTKFLYRHVCGNHIVWDAKDVQELRIIHRGRNDQRYGWKLRSELRQYANESANDDQARVTSAKGMLLGANKDEVIDKLFRMKIAPRKTLETAYDHATQEADCQTDVSPRSVWGMVQGVTHMSQDTPYADSRVELDRAAGKILSIAF
jgi:hypothetical protein